MILLLFWQESKVSADNSPSREAYTFSHTQEILRMFIATLKTVRHQFPSAARWIQSIPSHPIFLTAILSLSSHLYLSLPSGLFPSDFHTKTLYAFLFSPIRVTFPAHLSLLDLINLNYTWRREQVMSLKFSPAYYHFIPLRPKYSSRFSKTLKGHYCVHNSLSLTPVSSQMNAFNTVCVSFKVHYYIIQQRELSRYSDWLWDGRLRSRSSSPVGSIIFSSPQYPDWPWGPPSLLSNGYRRLFPRGKAVGAWRWPLTSN
jgi:hypothetical protein